jgi:DNA repair exonuclease SbcCD ATPase subunit
LKGIHNGFVNLCSQGGTTSEAKRKKLEADSYGYLNKKIKELEDENKRLKKDMHVLRTSAPVNPSKEMRSKNTLLQKELLLLQRQHEKLEKDHEELRDSDTHRELAELKDQLKDKNDRDVALEDSISNELEGRQNRIEALESVIAKLQRQNENLEEGELSKELKVKENRIKVLNGIIAKDKEMIEKLQNELTEAQQLLREGDKLITHEMSKQVQDDIRDWVQTVGWRKWKFVMNKDLRDYTDKCYADIAGKLGINNMEEMEDYYISEPDFHRTYGAYFKVCLSGKRQSTQSQMMKPCQGTCHSNVPNIQRTNAKTKRNLTQLLSLSYTKLMEMGTKG